MKLSEFKAGELTQGDQYTYFLPEPINHSFDIDNQELVFLLEKASLKLGELNSFGQFVPDIDMFIGSLVAKEAVQSNAIEGTQTNIEEALSEQDSIDPERRDDWLDVQNYIKSMNEAITTLSDLPLSNRLIKLAHKRLLSSGRGQHKTPGEFRKSQNWIGGATLQDAYFIPPHNDTLPSLLSDLEKFLNNETLNISHLIRIGIAHYQFETIHPFLDGNGRVGRLLITLYLVSTGVLEKPLLYLSDFFERNRQLYYENLTKVRQQNDLTQWLKFFLVGVIETSERSINILRNILKLRDNIHETRLIQMSGRLEHAQKLITALFETPIVDSDDVQRLTDLSPKSANLLIEQFEKYGILVEVTGQKRNRVFYFEEYLGLVR